MILTIEVTPEQKETINQLFNHYNWEYKELHTQSQSTEISATSPSPLDVEQFTVVQNEDAEECQHCFCRPCMTDDSNRQMWWESENAAPHRRNHFLRKDKYKRFWTNLYHRQVWKDPRYLSRKRKALSQDPKRKQCVYHKRDLMPQCIVKLVREWFPNLPNVPYIGHRWE